MKQQGLTTIFFATDVHGSNRCFKKFLNAAKFYGAQVLILGGDLSGKSIIPIIEGADGKFTSGFMGQKSVLSGEEVPTLIKTIEDSGSYPYVTDTLGYEALSVEEKRETLFKELILKRFQEWSKLADERLEGTNIKTYFTGGNDDPFYIDEAFVPKSFVNAEGKIIRVDEDHEMISSGYTNITPWNCPRDISEEELLRKIEHMTSQVNNMENCIFNLHCPPKDSGLDECPRLDADQKLIVKGGTAEMYGAGSSAVRSTIERCKPLLGLHGHIHESRGFCYIDRTLCVNPGSEYGEGVLKGVIVTLDKTGVKSFKLTSG